MYDNVPRRAPRNKALRCTLFGNRTGVFEVVRITDNNGHKKFEEVVEHFDPKMNRLIFKKDENGNVIIDRYAEAESQLATIDAAKKRCP